MRKWKILVTTASSDGSEIKNEVIIFDSIGDAEAAVKNIKNTKYGYALNVIAVPLYPI